MSRSFLRPFLLAAAGLAIACGGDEPAVDDPGAPDPTPLFGRVIFSSVSPDSYYVNNVGLWTMKPDGSDRRLLLNGRQWPESPTVSPDGRWVAFEDDLKLFVVDAGGARLHQIFLPAGAQAFSPKWSPNGDWIAFTLSGGGSTTSQIYLVHGDGTALHRVSAFTGENAGWPAWSPDGSSLVYVRSLGTSRSLVTKNIASGVESPILDADAHFTGSGPSWSPDGARILYLDVDTLARDWVIGQVVVATKAITVLGSARGNRPATLDPSGTHLVFGTGDLWVANADGSGAAPILADGRDNFEVFWTPAAAP